MSPSANRVMRDQYGADISGSTSRHLDTLLHQRFDRVITLCDKAREVCPEFPGEPDAVHWSFADPAAGGASDRATLPVFEQLAAALDARIEFLLLELLQPHTAA